MKYKEEKIDSENIYDGRILKLIRDNVYLPNGSKAVREVVLHNGGSAILCVNDKKILLVKQFRYPMDEVMYEIPAGKINTGEDEMTTAYRELEEEAGLKAKSLTKIFTMYPTPAYDSEKIHIYLAKDIEKSQQHLDEDEFLTSTWIDLKEANDMVESGKIKDAKTIIAILYAVNKSL